MASLEEFVSAVQSSIESLKQAQSSMDAPKQQAEELSSQFQGLGAESMATGSQGLKEGVEQTQGMVPPIITQLEQIIASAQGMKNGLRAATPELRPPPTPLDAAPVALREPVAKVGDPVTAPEPKPSAFRQELTGHDEGDKSKSRAQRFGRAFIRNAESLANQGKDAAQSGYGMIDARQPGGSAQTVETVGVPSQGPVIGGKPQGHASPDDVVGTMVVMAAVLVEGTSRWINRRKRQT